MDEKQCKGREDDAGMSMSSARPSGWLAAYCLFRSATHRAANPQCLGHKEDDGEVMGCEPAS